MPCDPKLKQALTDAFNEVDVDRSGQINAKEITTVLNSYYASSGQKGDANADAQMFLKEVDKSGDGQVSLQEFIDFFVKLCDS